MDKKNRNFVVLLAAVLVVMIASLDVKGKKTEINEVVKKIVVEIDYGTERKARTAEVELVKTMTALELLQTVATVETHPVGRFVVVTSIDGVKGKRGDMAWYYTVDGKPAEKIAFNNVINKTTHIKWNYKKDICSMTVDK